MESSVDGVTAEAVVAAARALTAGQLVILPTETIYGVFAAADRAESVARLMQAAARADGAAVPAQTWHAPDGECVLEALRPSRPLHRRAIRKLWPGPVRFLIELGEEGARESVARLGAIPGLFDANGVVSVRVPDQGRTREVLREAGVTAIAQRLSAFGWGDGREVGVAADGRAAAAGVAAIVDAGRTKYGLPSSTVRLNAQGGYSIVHEGAMDARTIHKRLERVVLFVCTGNTCRSPLAEAIARSLHERSEYRPIPTVFRSAGTAAVNGVPYSPEVMDILHERGDEITGSRSRELTKAMIAEAEVIYGLTRGHVRGILALDASAEGKTFTLDPTGADVPDPLGSSAEVYRRTAERLERVLKERLGQLNTPEAEEEKV